MAIITLAEYKTYTSLYDSSTQSDAEIEAIIPMVEEDYIKIQGKEFSTITGDTTNTSAVIEEVSDTTWLKIAQLVDGVDGSIRGKVTVINEDDSEVTLDANATATAEAEEMTVYPIGSNYIAAKMIKYTFDSNAVDNTISAESLEKHSVTWRDTDTSQLLCGYPLSIVGNIKRFMSLKAGQTTYEGQAKGLRDIQTFADGQLIDDGENLNARNADGT